MQPRPFIEAVQEAAAASATAASEHANLIAAAAAWGIIAFIFLYNPKPRKRRT